MGYECPSCSKSYSTKYSRNRHMQLAHEDVAEDLRSSQEDSDENSLESEESQAESVVTTDEGAEEAKDQELAVSSDEDDPIVELAKEAESQKHFRELVTQKIFSCEELKISDVYKELMETVDKYTDSGYDLDEAVLSAVRKRRYLLNRIYDDQHDDSEEEGSGEDGMEADDESEEDVAG